MHAAHGAAQHAFFIINMFRQACFLEAQASAAGRKQHTTSTTVEAAAL
jgi:hypothetical protein